MKSKFLPLIVLILISFSSVSYSQTIKEYKSFSLDIDKLPEYIVMFSEVTGRVMGTINNVIDSKRSDYEPALNELEDIITDRKKLKVRNQTDLLNLMLGFGYEYIDAISIPESDMSKIIFRKQVKYRK